MVKEAERQEQESVGGVGRERAEYLEGSRFNAILDLQDALVQQAGWRGPSTLHKIIQKHKIVDCWNLVAFCNRRLTNSDSTSTKQGQMG